MARRRLEGFQGIERGKPPQHREPASKRKIGPSKEGTPCILGDRYCYLRVGSSKARARMTSGITHHH
jgi:hypothetical protein